MIGRPITLMEKQQAISQLQRNFPEFAGAEFARGDGELSATIFNGHDFACFVANLFTRAEPKRVQDAFDQMEDFLRVGSAEVRDWVCSFLEALQDMAAWKSSGSDVFLRFLGPETHRAWSALEAIRRDLEDCSTLEAEVLMWRIVHRRPAHTGRIRAA
jgi:hypothetical protein